MLKLALGVMAISTMAILLCLPAHATEPQPKLPNTQDMVMTWIGHLGTVKCTVFDYTPHYNDLTNATDRRKAYEIFMAKCSERQRQEEIPANMR